MDEAPMHKKPEPSESPATARKAALKEQRDREGARAMAEYQAAARAVDARTARLRALRLAKEAADAERARTEKKVKEGR
jgi:hypothetical protein